MATKRKRQDFVKRLEVQLKMLRARRFDKLDVELVVDEWEGVVGCYRGEVRCRAKRLIVILMRSYYVYGDWNDLEEWDTLREALKESPSLAKCAAADIRSAYKSARLGAELHGVHGWPERCPWRTLDELGAAVKARYKEYRALEWTGNVDFGDCRRVPRQSNR
jgi:hypothetical protein